METPFNSLPEAIDALRAAVDDYRSSVTKMQEWLTFETEQLWRDQAALRDEVHESVTTLSNRIEANTRPTVTLPFGENPQDCHDCLGTGALAGGVRCERCEGFGKVRYAHS